MVEFWHPKHGGWHLGTVVHELTKGKLQLVRLETATGKRVTVIKADIRPVSDPRAA